MPSSGSPHRVLDLATLTGACIVALGLKVAGLFSNNDSFCKELTAACRKTGERVWRLPLHDDFKEQLKSSVADLKNMGGKWGGAVTAAKFLEQFVGSTPWIHLDIAGPSWCDAENSTRDAGGTGCFVRSLVAYVEGWSQSQRSGRGKRAVDRRMCEAESTTPDSHSQLQMLEQPVDGFESRDVERIANPVTEGMAMADGDHAEARCARRGHAGRRILDCDG